MILAPTLTINSSNGPSVVEYNAVIVSGAGSLEVNGTYIFNGQENGKNKYVLNDSYVAWSSIDGSWDIYSEFRKYVSFNDTEFPWDATFQVDDANEPAPTLTPTNV